MPTRRWFLFVLLLLSVTSITSADTYPFQSKAFVEEGRIIKVDADRDRVAFRGDDRQNYTLDTSGSEIKLSDGGIGLTADLSPGMRVHVIGKLLSANIAEITLLRVMEEGLPERAKRPAGPQTLPGAPLGPDDPNAITLRGTVDSIDTGLGAFVVKVKDHTRTILLADNTDLSGLGKTDPEAFPVKTGDRVTVAGELQPDGRVLAGAVSFSRDIAFPAPAIRPRGIVLVGQVSSESDRYTSRDIKIRLENNREVKIKVSHGIPIRRDGQPVSVHDLRNGDSVRITGIYEGNDFRASHIEVLQPPDTHAPSGYSRL